MTESLLAALNPGVDFSRAGTRIAVADVRQKPRQAKVAKIIINKNVRSLSAFDAEGKLVAFYPASIGSKDKPAPSGEFKVKAVERNPVYHYDPRFAFKGVKAKHKFNIQAGPKNPVGLVWIDLSAPTYGIHGTPSPEKIGKTESHGCIRLTNWDALDLAAMVHRGTIVDFVG
jgi:lipoprotein-anchoring transpeptidase ErfK/SrfK